MLNIVGIITSINLSDLSTMLFFFFGETSLMFFIATRLFNIKTTWTRLFSSAFILSIFVLLVRKTYLFYKIPFGTHVFILGAIFALLLLIMYRTKMYVAISSALICFALILAGSPLIYKVMELLNIDMQNAFRSFLFSTFLGYIEDVYLMVIAIILTITKFNIYKYIK